MKIAYGTYAMPTIPLEEAIPLLAGIGYDGIEICIGPKHQSLPEQFGSERRERLKRLLDQHRMGVPAMFVLGSVLAKDEAEHGATLARVRDTARLARDLALPGPPVVAIGIGGRSAGWERQRHEIVRQLRDYAALAEREHFILAGEAHCGAAVDRSERVVWLLDTVAHPAIRFHFDIVHFYLANEPIEQAVKMLVPYTAHTHITDAIKHPDGRFDLKLLGQGRLDSVAYLKAMNAAGWTGYITLEVSVRVWGQPGYDPIQAAKFSYGTLDTAFEAAGVTRSR